MLIVVVLLATVFARFALVVAVAYLLLPRGPTCPTCRAEMSLIRHRFLQRAFPLIQHRWCLECGWNGLVRRGPAGPRAGLPAHEDVTLE